MKLVHADLAARNVLLSSQKVSKIADFGLSARLYNYSYCVKSEQDLLPWRWMAPESIKRLQFSEKSDVWAYGVMLWELYSLGDLPYCNMSCSHVLENFSNGLRLERSAYDAKYVHGIMKNAGD